MYDECQEMRLQESSLKAAAREMDAWQRRGDVRRGEVPAVIGREKAGGEGSTGSASSSGGEMEWEGGEDDDDAFWRRRAGVRQSRGGAGGGIHSSGCVFFIKPTRPDPTRRVTDLSAVCLVLNGSPSPGAFSRRTRFVSFRF